jgi:hypothetical protein
MHLVKVMEVQAVVETEARASETPQMERLASVAVAVAADTHMVTVVQVKMHGAAMAVQEPSLFDT